MRDRVSLIHDHVVLAASTACQGQAVDPATPLPYLLQQCHRTFLSYHGPASCSHDMPTRQLAVAIAEENYTLAAKLRDEQTVR